MCCKSRAAQKSWLTVYRQLLYAAAAAVGAASYSYANYKYRLINTFKLCSSAPHLHIWRASFIPLKSNKEVSAFIHPKEQGSEKVLKLLNKQVVSANYTRTFKVMCRNTEIINEGVRPCQLCVKCTGFGESWVCSTANKLVWAGAQVYIIHWKHGGCFASAVFLFSFIFMIYLFIFLHVVSIFHSRETV